MVVGSCFFIHFPASRKIEFCVRFVLSLGAIFLTGVEEKPFLTITGRFAGFQAYDVLASSRIKNSCKFLLAHLTTQSISVPDHPSLSDILRQSLGSYAE